MLPSVITFFFSLKQKELFQKYSKSADLFFEISLKKIKSCLGEIPVINNFFAHFPQITFLDVENELDFLNKVLEFLPESKLNDPDIDEVYFAYIDGLYPLLSTKLTKNLNNRHYKYLSQYSYSENLPEGIVPKFLSREFVLTLPQDLNILSHDFLLKNLNEYDVEIFYQPPDLRYHRLDFSGKNRRSLQLIKDFLSVKENCEYEEIQEILSNHLHFFRSSPSYIEIEISRSCDLNCSFSPKSFFNLKQEGHFAKENLTKIIEQLDANFTSNYTISFAGLGEPLLNPKITDLISIALQGKHIEELIIETFLYTEIEQLNFLSKLKEPLKQKISFIINLSTLNKETYKSLYGKDFFSKVYKNLEVLASFIDKKNIHLQFMKILELEDELDNYYKTVESMGFGIILQKYNRYGGIMPEKRAADLTPLQREFCWHLNRDLYINFDGTVAVCKQVPHKIIGDISQDSLPSIWKKNQPLFEQSFQGKYDNSLAPCATCDEWYTFNA